MDNQQALSFGGTALMRLGLIVNMAITSILALIPHRWRDFFLRLHNLSNSASGLFLRIVSRVVVSAMLMVITVTGLGLLLVLSFATQVDQLSNLFFTPIGQRNFEDELSTDRPDTSLQFRVDSMSRSNRNHLVDDNGLRSLPRPQIRHRADDEIGRSRSEPMLNDATNQRNIGFHSGFEEENEIFQVTTGDRHHTNCIMTEEKSGGRCLLMVDEESQPGRGHRLNGPGYRPQSSVDQPSSSTKPVHVLYIQ